jgi:hypothetical protein
VIAACGLCGAVAHLDDMWRCEGCADSCRDTEPSPPPDYSVRPPPLHAAVLAYDGEDWEGAGRAEYELALQEMGDRE